MLGEGLSPAEALTFQAKEGKWRPGAEVRGQTGNEVLPNACSPLPSPPHAGHSSDPAVLCFTSHFLLLHLSY